MSWSLSWERQRLVNQTIYLNPICVAAIQWKARLGFDLLTLHKCPPTEVIATKQSLLSVRATARR